LPKITEPILIIQLSDDTRIDSNSANYIHTNVKSRDKSMVVISSAGHSLLEEPFKNRVYEEVYAFIKRV